MLPAGHYFQLRVGKSIYSFTFDKFTKFARVSGIHLNKREANYVFKYYKLWIVHFGTISRMG